MIKFFKRWFFPFFVLFVVFCEQIFYCYLSIRGIILESGLLQYEFIAISVIAYMILLRDCLTSMRGISTRKVITPMVFLMLFYYMVAFFQHAHYATLLRFGSICISSAIVGIHLNRRLCFYEIDCLLPYFVIFFGIIMGTVGLESAKQSELLRDESGLSYQKVSYYMAEMYAYSIYYVFFSSCREIKKFRIFRIVMMLMFVFCPIVCLLSGGRGAFVFIIFITCFLLFMLCKSGRLKIPIIIAGVLVSFFVFMFLAYKFDLWNSVGFSRISNNISSDNERFIIREKALASFVTSPVFGHGLGSIWGEVGIYSHNMFLDFLVDGGIIGFIVGCLFFLKMFKRLFLLPGVNSCFIFFMIMFLKSFVMNLFSGYWFGVYQYWMIFGLLYSTSPSFIKKYEET